VSNINYLSINENFPVAGQDNDTQVFRDNFDTIKTSLRVAKEEITDLQDNASRTDIDNDFGGNLVQNAVLQNVSSRIKNYGAPITAPTQEISFSQALYHIIRFGGTSSLSFIDFPSDVVNNEGLGSIGKVTLELYGDGTERTLSLVASGTTVFKKSANFPETLKVTSATNPVIIEVWQHGLENIFLNYLGQFS
jgi:hypothetical protein